MVVAAAVSSSFVHNNNRPVAFCFQLLFRHSVSFSLRRHYHHYTTTSRSSVTHHSRQYFLLLASQRNSYSTLSDGGIATTSSYPNPRWWTDSIISSSTTTNNNTSTSTTRQRQQYIKFDQHVAHVVIPPMLLHHDEKDVGRGGGAGATMTCEDVVRWVLQAYAQSRSIHNHENNDNDDKIKHYDTVLDNPLLSSTYADYDNNNNQNNHQENVRRLQIQKEWNEGEDASSTSSTTTDMVRRLDPNYRHDPTLFPQIPITTTTTTTHDELLTPCELLALGSVWQLSHTTLSVDDKPIRLNIGHTNCIAKPGDYFRIHFDPRRFVYANKYDWGKLCVVDDDVSSPHGSNNNNSSSSSIVGSNNYILNNKPGVIVSRNDDAGYIIINKPPNIPVHSRVDNSLENVASCIGRMLWLEAREKNKEQSNMIVGLTNNNNNSTTTTIDDDDNQDEDDGWHHKKKRRRMNQQQKKKMEPLIYVGTPQRLDQNTSGLLVVATKKTFASYFAGLLQSKTRDQLRRSTRIGGVHKSYRCLVCILVPTTTTRMMHTTEKDEIDRLGQYTILQHYLEPSIRSPKRFVSTIPDDTKNVDSWAECLLRITHIGQPCTVDGHDGSPSSDLSRSLWGEFGKPENCISVVEVEVELLTGRTHQIRGQLAAEGFPLVGDVQYGGAVPTSSDLYRERCAGRCEGFLDSESLALQCCSLEFLDPRPPPLNDDNRKDSEEQCWNTFRLESAFWTPYLNRYNNDVATMSVLEELSTYSSN
jgi:23S rRNA-/tRNA-specific pseudouridylate synthase